MSAARELIETLHLIEVIYEKNGASKLPWKDHDRIMQLLDMLQRNGERRGRAEWGQQLRELIGL